MAAGVDLLEQTERCSALAPGLEGYRILIAAPDADRRTLCRSIAARLPGWEVFEADGADQARFALQLNDIDVLLLDAAAARGAGAPDWLAGIWPVAIALLADEDVDYLRTALEQGTTGWLPRQLALQHPALLAAVLRQAARARALDERLRTTAAALAGARRRVHRLVNRLWETVPFTAGASWFTQRHMLERLQEEAARVERFGGPLTVALGELLPAGSGDANAADDLAAWAAQQLNRVKRRSDVAGQYGAQGFMLVLPRTTEPAASGCCRRLQTVLEQPAAGLRGPWRACFGVASLKAEEGQTVTRLLRQAEERLEEAKGSDGRVGS